MTNTKTTVGEALMFAKSIVDTAFKNYPDSNGFVDTDLGNKFQEEYNKRSEVDTINEEIQTINEEDAPF